MSGFCTSAARLGAPDTGLISYYEMMDQVGGSGDSGVAVLGQKGKRGGTGEARRALSLHRGVYVCTDTRLKQMGQGQVGVW